MSEWDDCICCNQESTDCTPFPENGWPGEEAIAAGSSSVSSEVREELKRYLASLADGTYYIIRTEDDGGWM